MQSKSVNGYSAALVDAVIAGSYGMPVYRVRAESLDSENAKLRDLTNLLLEGSKVFHSRDQDIKRAAELAFREASVSLGSYQATVLALGPVSFHRLGEPSGTTAADTTGNGHTGTYQNSPTLGSASLLGGDATNTAVSFDGTNDYVSVPTSSAYNVTRITLEAWVKTSSSGTSLMIAARDVVSSNRQFQFFMQSTGELALNIWIGGALKSYQTSAKINDGATHHVVATYDGAYVRLYIDSVLHVKTAQTGNVDSVTASLLIGSLNAAGNFWSGSLDEVAFYPRGLSAAEVRNNFQAGSGDLSEIDFTRDRVKVYVALRMPTAGNDDTTWAEWALGVFVLSSPTRQVKETGIERPVIAQDQTVLLTRDKFDARWTIAAGQNYITGTNGILDICRSAGLDVSAWAIAATTSTLPSTIDFKIGDTKLTAVNYLLEAISYKRLRFKGDGQGVLEPIALPAARSVEDTIITNSASVVSADNVEEGIELSLVSNVVVLYKSNPDADFLQSRQVNTALTSKTNIYAIGKNVYTEQVEAADQPSIDQLAKDKLNRFSQINKRLKLPTRIRPFHDDDDKYAVQHAGFPNALGTVGDFLEEEWTLYLDVTKVMEHTLTLITDVVS